MVPLYNNLAGAYNNLGRYEQALFWAEKGAAIVERYYPDDQYRLGHIYNTMGVTLEGLGRYDEGLEAKKKALANWQAVLGPRHQEVGLAHLNLGTSYYYQGDYVKAAEEMDLSLDILSESLGEGHPYISAIINNLSVLEETMLNYEQALIYTRRGMRQRENFLSDESADLAQSYNNYGTMLSKLGQVDSALVYLQKALTIYDKVDNRPLYYSTLSTIGQHLTTIGEYTEAKSSLLMAIAGLTENTGEQNLMISDAKLYMGELLQAQNDQEGAIQYFQESLSILQQLYQENNSEIARIYNKLGECEISRQNYQQAIAFFDLALQANNAVATQDTLPAPLARTQYHSLAGKGKAYASWKKSTPDKRYLQDTAAYYLQEALKLLASEKTNMTFDRSKERLSALAKPVLSDLVALFWQKANEDEKYAHHLFEYFEQSRSLILLESMQTVNAISFGEIPQEVLSEEINLRAKINDLDIQLLELTRSGQSADRQAIYTLNEELYALQQEYIEFKTAVARKYPRYYRFQYGENLRSLSELQIQLAPDQALLEYFLTEDMIYVMVVRKNSYQLHQIERDFPLEDWVEKFCNSVRSRRVPSLPVFAQVAHQLYEKLMAPLDTESLPSRLIVVADGILAYLPFEALIKEAPQKIYEPATYAYLLDSFAFSYAYSANLLMEMTKKTHLEQASNQIYALAPFSHPNTLAQANTRFILGESQRLELEPLLATKAELDNLKEKYSAVCHYGDQATKNNFSIYSPNYRVLHLATHGQANTQEGKYSFLVFAPLAEAEACELLYAQEIYGLRLNADLVVLSACETNLGEIQDGEGVISLARAFAYAGAKSITSSLWQVPDTRSEELMSYYYEALSVADTPKDLALSQAKRRYLKAHLGKDAHPVNWAAFIGIGDMSALQK
jgi:CHAT domain-containing protein/Tfp pilus assembly protein PilF